MKQCPNCFTSCSDSEQFCPACGTWLQNSAPSAGLNPGGPGNPSLYGKKKSRKKIWIIVLCTVLILCTAGGTGFFVWNKIQNDRIQERKARYAENIESGERYVLDQNYERAETAFLEAKTIEPRKPEPYIGLYEVYTAQEQEEKQTQTVNEAKSSLSAEDFQEFENKKQEIDEKYTLPADRLTILKDIGPLDTVPIRVKGEVWIIEQNGKFSFLNEEGEIVSDSPADYLQFIFTGFGYTAACLADNHADSGMSSHNQWPYNDGSVSNCSGYGGTGPIMDIQLTEDGVPRITDASIDSYNFFKESLSRDSRYDLIRNPIDEVPAVPVAVTKKGETDTSIYWIWNPIADQVTGPYTTSSYSSLAMKLVGDENATFSIPLQEGAHENINDAHYMKIFSPYVSQENGKTTLWSFDGTAALRDQDEISGVTAIDEDAISYQKNGRIYLLDGSLQPLVITEAEGISGMLDDRVLIQTEGTWKLASVSEDPDTKEEKDEIIHNMHVFTAPQNNSYVVRDNPIFAEGHWDD